MKKDIEEHESKYFHADRWMLADLSVILGCVATFGSAIFLMYPMACQIGIGFMDVIFMACLMMLPLAVGLTIAFEIERNIRW